MTESSDNHPISAPNHPILLVSFHKTEKPPKHESYPLLVSRLPQNKPQIENQTEN